MIFSSVIIFKKSRLCDLNTQPADYKSAALPIELRRQNRAARVGLEPTTIRLTAEGSAIELPGIIKAGDAGFEPAMQESKS